MKTIKLSRKDYNGISCIFINCEPDPLFDLKINKFHDKKWSQSNRCWYINDSEESFKKLRSHFRNDFIIDTTALHKRASVQKPFRNPGNNKGGRYGPVEMEICSNNRLRIKFLGRFDRSWIEEIRQYGRAYYDPDRKEWSLSASRVAVDSLSEYFNSLGVGLRVIKGKPKKEISKIRQTVGNEIRSRSISTEAKEGITLLENDLSEKRFSRHTIKTYTSLLEFFFKYFSDKLPAEIETADLSDFMNEYIIRLGFSASLQNQIITTIKTYYELAGASLLDIEGIKRPKRGRPLPQVFSKEEVTRILNSPSNIKHKLILWIIYSCGLRRSEIINIKLSDINAERGILHIRSGKGNNDRIVPLSRLVIKKIEEYRASYNPRSYLFEGQRGGRYSAGSVYSIFKAALRRAGIHRDVGVHSLRHSYATHLHESGLDIRYIQELLGHKNSKTTEIYTHVSRRNLEEIKSPIEDLGLH